LEKLGQQRSPFKMIVTACLQPLLATHAEQCKMILTLAYINEKE